MTVLILVTFLVFLSSIHGEFNGPYSNLQITQTKTRVPFSTSDLVISNESVVHSDNESKSIVQISVKLAADDSTANQFHTTVSAETSARSTAISEATADSNQTTTTTESTTTLLTFQTGDFFFVLPFETKYSRSIISLR